MKWESRRNIKLSSKYASCQHASCRKHNFWTPRNYPGGLECSMKWCLIKNNMECFVIIWKHLFCAITMKLSHKLWKILAIRFCFVSQGHFSSVLADSRAWYTVCSATGKHSTWKKWYVCWPLLISHCMTCVCGELLLFKQMYEPFPWIFSTT